MAPTRALPLELLLAIIDNIDDEDKQTLTACSMSCKALIGPTYRRLYHPFFPNKRSSVHENHQLPELTLSTWQICSTFINTQI
jgi:hypothetical protein